MHASLLKAYKEATFSKDELAEKIRPFSRKKTRKDFAFCKFVGESLVHVDAIRLYSIGGQYQP